MFELTLKNLPDNTSYIITDEYNDKKKEWIINNWTLILSLSEIGQGYKKHILKLTYNSNWEEVEDHISLPIKYSDNLVENEEGLLFIWKKEDFAWKKNLYFWTTNNNKELKDLSCEDSPKPGDLTPITVSGNWLFTLPEDWKPLKIDWRYQKACLQYFENWKTEVKTFMKKTLISTHAVHHWDLFKGIGDDPYLSYKLKQRFIDKTYKNNTEVENLEKVLRENLYWRYNTESYDSNKKVLHENDEAEIRIHFNDLKWSRFIVWNELFSDGNITYLPHESFPVAPWFWQRWAPKIEDTYDTYTYRRWNPTPRLFVKCLEDTSWNFDVWGITDERSWDVNKTDIVQRVTYFVNNTGNNTTQNLINTVWGRYITHNVIFYPHTLSRIPRDWSLVWLWLWEESWNWDLPKDHYRFINVTTGWETSEYITWIPITSNVYVSGTYNCRFDSSVDIDDKKGPEIFTEQDLWRSEKQKLYFKVVINDDSKIIDQKIEVIDKKTWEIIETITKFNNFVDSTSKSERWNASWITLWDQNHYFLPLNGGYREDWVIVRVKATDEKGNISVKSVTYEKADKISPQITYQIHEERGQKYLKWVVITDENLQDWRHFFIFARPIGSKELPEITTRDGQFVMENISKDLVDEDFRHTRRDWSRGSEAWRYGMSFKSSPTAIVDWDNRIYPNDKYEFVISSQDEYGNRTDKVVQWDPDTTGPEITVDTSKKDIVSASATDQSNIKSFTVHTEGNEGNKKDYTPGTEIAITRDDHGKKLIFTATDEHNNVTTKEVTLTFSDTSAPTITVNTDTPNRVFATITDDNTTTTVRYYKDQSDNKVPYTSDTPIAITESDNGKTLVFESIDVHGNKTTKEVTLKHSDVTPPEITIDTSKTNKVSITVNDSTPTTCQYWFKDTPDTKKDYLVGTELDITREMNNKTIVFSCYDTAGNKTEKEQTLSWTDTTPKDTQAPSITTKTDVINKVSAEITDTNNFTATYHFKDNPSTKFPYTSNQEVDITPALANKTIVFEATDEHGNKAEPKEVTLTYRAPTPTDTTAPSITITSPKTNTVVATSDDPSATCQYWFKDTSNVKTNYVAGTELSLTQANHGKTLVFGCIDTSGNKSEKEFPVSFTDTTPKDTSSPVITTDTSKTNRVSATITDNDPNTKVTYHWKDTPNAKLPYTSGTELTITPDKAGKTLVFTATDSAGNTSTKEVPSITYTDTTPKDTTAPSITINTSKTNTISVTSDDPNAVCQYWFKDTPINKTTYKLGQEVAITQAMNGKTIVFSCSDAASNKTEKEHTLTWINPNPTPADQTGPTITQSNPDKNKVRFTVSDPSGVKSIKTYFKDTPTQSKDYVNNSDITITENDNGKTIVVEAIDSNGNKTIKEVTLTFTKDRTQTSIGGVIDTANTGNGNGNNGNPDANKNNKPEISITSKNGELTFSATDKDGDLDKSTYTFDNGAEKDLPNTAKIKVTLDQLGKTYNFKSIDLKKNETTKAYKITEDDLSDEDKAKLKKKDAITPVKVTVETNKPVTDQCKNVTKVLNTSDLRFKDINNSDFKSYIEYLATHKGTIKNDTYANQGVVNNTEYFNPNNSITRAEFVKMLVRSLGCNYQSEKGVTFSDVDPNMWYAEYINFAVKQGWVNGYKDGTFRPNAAITRQEAAKIFVRATDLKLKNNVSYDDVTYENEFKGYIETLGSNNIIGARARNFNPQGLISRGEVAKLVANVLQNR